MVIFELLEEIGMNSVVVTGVSTGIGWGTAKVLIQKGFHVFGSVRKSADAERLSAEWGPAFTPLIFDVTDVEKVHAAAAAVASQLDGRPLFGLVNNAGISVPGPLVYLPIDEFRHQLEVNLVGPLIVTQAFVNLLKAAGDGANRPGRIVNISSIGGKIAGPFLGAYHASKYGLEGLSETLRRELLIHGIDVIVIGPGAVATPIWDKAGETDSTPYQQTEYGPALEKYRTTMIARGHQGYPPEYLGEIVWQAVTTDRPRTRYAVVPGTLMNWILPRLLPSRWVDAVLARSLGLQRRD
jgi:NAD(P)-dependent dehydrogenase (short-subunit alcohol dehydrogenase family)